MENLTDTGAFMLINCMDDTGRIATTDYFKTEGAKAGMMFMSNMQSTLRLLVPPSQFATFKRETKHTKLVEMEIHADRILLFFIDKNPQPFAVQMSLEAVDFLPNKPMKTKLHIYTDLIGELTLYKTIEARVIATRSKVSEWSAGSSFL